MWIICAGAKRSGSTLQYNLISNLVEKSGLGKRIPHFKTQEFSRVKNEFSSFDGYKVIKIHAYDSVILQLIESDKAIVFHCYRDIRDVVVSFINKGWIDHNINEIEKTVYSYLKELSSWEKISQKIISRKYEHFIQDYIGELKFIEKQLGIEIFEEDRLEIANSLEIKSLKNKQDKISVDNKQESYGQVFNKYNLLHQNHIHNGDPNQFIEALSKDEILCIERIAYKYIERNGYDLYWPKTDVFLSLSQHADDYVAWQLLGKKTNGFAIEIGAFDGLHLSNVYSLEKIGWDTMNIEPNPKMFKEVEINRPDSLNINCAVVSDKSIKKIKFYAEEIGVLSGCSYDEIDVERRYSNRGLAYAKPMEINVLAKTLDQLLIENKLGSQKINLVSIDVEGFELEVLNGIDFDRVIIGMIIIESNSDEFDKRIFKFFEDKKEYVFLGRNYQNLFFSHRSEVKRSRLKKLSTQGYVKAVQYHPFNSEMDLNSVYPNFIKSNVFKKEERFLKFL